MSKKKVIIEEYKGNPVFSIWTVDQNDQKKYSKPLISFGLTKTKAILSHINELQEFVDEYDQSSSSSSNQKAKIKFKPITKHDADKIQQFLNGIVPK